MSLLMENIPDVERPKPRPMVKTLAICTMVVAGLGLATSIACAIIVALGWSSLRKGSGDDGTVGRIFLSTGIAHTTYWITVLLSVLLYVATVILKLRKPKDPQQRKPKKRAFKAS